MFVASFLALVQPLLAAQGTNADSPAAPSAAPRTDMTTLLIRMDRAASLYRQAALKFSCRETLHTDGGPVLRFDYLYVIGEDGQLRDHRTRPGDSQAIETAPPVNHWLKRAYSFVFLFQRGRWPHLRYRILETGRAGGRDIAAVEFEPVPPIRPEINDWTGTAWVETATGRIVRVEAARAEDVEAMRLFEAAMALGERVTAGKHRFSVMNATTEFGTEKNGMLLPSKAIVEIVEHRIPGLDGQPSSSRVVDRMHQTYERYRFFGVKAEAEHLPEVSPP